LRDSLYSPENRSQYPVRREGEIEEEGRSMKLKVYFPMMIRAAAIGTAALIVHAAPALAAAKKGIDTLPQRSTTSIKPRVTTPTVTNHAVTPRTPSVQPRVTVPVH
jgi:hypothetical protein